MKIHSIELKNFRNIENQSLSLDEGLYTISGENGEGKTSLLKAFALMICNDTENSLKDEIRWGSDSFTIKMHFTHHGQEFKYDVTFDGGSSRNLYIDKQYYKNSAAVEKLKEYFDPKLSMASMIVMQGQADLVDVKPSERRDLLKKIFSLSFQQELETLQGKKDSLKEKLDVLMAEVSSLETKEYDLQSVKELPFDESEYELKQEKILSLQSEFQLQQTRLNTYTEDRKRLDSLQSDVDSYNQRIERLKEKINVLFVEIKTFEDSLSLNDDSRIVSLQQQISEIDFDTSAMDEEISDLRNSVLDINIEDKKGLLSRQKELTQEIATLTARHKQEKENLSLIENGECPTCGQKCSPEHNEDLEKSIERVASQIKTSREDISLIETQLEEFEEKVDTQKSIQESILKVEQRKEKFLRELHDKKKDLEYLLQAEESKQESQKEVLRDKISTHNKTIQETLEEIDSYNEPLEKKKSEYEELKKKTPSRKPVVDEGVPVRIAELQQEVKDYESVISWNENANQINESIKKQKERDNKILVEKKSTIDNDQETLNIVDEAIKHYRNALPSFIISSKIQQHQDSVNLFLADIYPKYTVEFKENKTALKMLYGPKNADVSNASGFERQIFSMAYKYALCSENDYGVLFLDEVDSFASEKNSQLFYETIGKLKSKFNQIFVITQKKNTKDLLEREYSSSLIEVANGEFSIL